MIKVQSSLQYQQALAKTVLKQDIPRPAATGTGTGPEVRARPVNTPLAAASLTDSLEEIGMMFSEKVEKKTKGLNRRQINTQHLRSNRGAVERIERLGELYQMLDDEQQEKLEARLGALKGVLGREPDAEQLVASVDDDPARCDLLLRMTLREADRSGDIATANAAGEALNKLDEQYGESVRAGLNTASAIASFTTDPTEKQAIRHLYYHGIVKHQSAAVMLDSLLERFGREQFVPGLRTLQRALAEDIASLTPSLSSRSLHKIHVALSEAGQLTQMIAHSDKLLNRLRSGGKIPLSALDGLAMTRRLLGIAEMGLQPRDITAIVKEFEVEQPQARMRFLNGLLPLVNDMPPKLWRDQKNQPEAATLLRATITKLINDQNRAGSQGAV
ncbi:type III secretion protein W [Erwinia persicina]|uniref:Type III secretion system gatekeeper subunit SctW n=1 Tax=Erwinia plantamica TaxID=3237104 RepID=A0ABW7CJW1_9GAMM|nr:type III secretion system gatekeeper subunit SctW [Erwinia persicina]MCP1437774.1 type III secretion protein W [Erwinia persicina]